MKSIVFLIAAVAAFSLLGITKTMNAADAKPAKKGKETRVLIIGGGSSHDFKKYFNEADTATINATGKAVATYTDRPDSVVEALKNTDVLYMSNNQPLPTTAQSAIMEFAEAKKKGMLLVHAATWLNWKDWPKFNSDLVTGFSKGHDRLGEFEVTVVKPKHAIMKGVPATFKITDELYNFEPNPAGNEREVLATAKSPNTGKEFPVVWVTKGHKARVVNITLGHDARAHDLPAFRAILTNSIAWAAKGN